MKKLFALLLCFCAIVAILNYGTDNEFSMRETFERVTTEIKQAPEIPNIKDYQLTFNKLEFEPGGSIFDEVAHFFQWLGETFVTLWNYIMFAFRWLYFLIQYLVYIIEIVIIFFGELITV